LQVPCRPEANPGRGAGRSPGPRGPGGAGVAGRARPPLPTATGVHMVAATAPQAR